MQNDKYKLIRDICGLLSKGDAISAKLEAEKYPFNVESPTPRKFSAYDSMRLFLRDGFVDRYTGSKLVFPGTLYVLSQELPEHFPSHPHGKLSESHIVHWELFPTVDHIIPVARGGADSEVNWVTTSMLTNQAKLHWTINELGWEVKKAGNLNDWDGLTEWFQMRVDQNPKLLTHSSIKKWHRVAKKCVGAL
tara:strand:+ start:10905 stop:11480 length:576 start_codon:yes stop_codon:yes gene_type:complete